MPVPDYYSVLGVPPTATQQQIREAYKRTALKTHPDRVPTTDPTRPARTRQFQQVNDAYYTLSDPARRREYDQARRTHEQAFYQNHDNDSAEWQEEQFADVFEEMLREEGVQNDQQQEGQQGAVGKMYSIVGGISGAALGFILGNVPGMLAGAVAGNRLGAVRDAKGKSVYEVFQGLPQGDKAKVLADLAAKVLSHAAKVSA